MLILIAIDAVMVCIVAGLLMEVFHLRKQLEEQKIICANLKTWQPKWTRIQKEHENHGGESPTELLGIAFESMRNGRQWVGLAEIGHWLHDHDHGKLPQQCGFYKLSKWIDSLDGWKIIRDPDLYGGTPAVVMKK